MVLAGHEVEEALQEISRCSKRIGACLPCMPWPHSKLIYCRNERPFSVDNFSFGVASNLFMVHAGSIPTIFCHNVYFVILWFSSRNVLYLVVLSL